MGIALRRPSPGTITSGFGPRKGSVGSAYHQGIDFSWMRPDRIQDWTIYAAAAGRVTWTRTTGGFGRLVKLDHGNGRETLYAHTSRYLVAEGDYVSAGAPLAIIGDTGIGSGPHLHFEYRIHGTPKNPAPYFLAGAALDLIKRLIPEKEHHDMRLIYNKDAPASQDTTRRAIVGELTFKIITGPQSTRERKLFGKPVNFTQGEWDAQRASVEENRRAVGLPPASAGSAPAATAFAFEGIARPAGGA